MEKITEIDKLFRDELLKIKNEKSFVDFIFNYCEAQEDRDKLLYYIRNVCNDRKKVLLMAS